MPIEKINRVHKIEFTWDEWTGELRGAEQSRFVAFVDSDDPDGDKNARIVGPEPIALDSLGGVVERASAEALAAYSKAEAERARLAALIEERDAEIAALKQRPAA